GEVRPGGVAGDRDLPAPFAVQAVAAHEGLAGDRDLHVERHRQGRRAWGRALLPDLGQLLRGDVWLSAVGLDDVERHHAGRQPVGDAEVAARHANAGVQLLRRDAAIDANVGVDGGARIVAAGGEELRQRALEVEHRRWRGRQIDVAAGAEPAGLAVGGGEV